MIASAVRALLIGDATLNGLINGVYAIRVPQEKDPPHICLLVADVDPNHCKDNASRLDEVTLTLIVFSLDALELNTISERVRTVLDHFEGTSANKEIGILYQGERDQFDDKSGLYLNQMEFEVTYKKV